MTSDLALASAFFVRDLRMAVSYRIGFALSVLGSLVQIAMLFFLSRLLSAGAQPLLEQYGGSYFGFVMVGVAFTTFMALGMAGLSTRIREAQLMGTLELMVLSPTRLPVLLIYSSLWSHVFAATTVVVYLGVGLLLGLDFSGANLPVAFLGMVLAIVSFNALGLVAASVVIVIKQGNPVTWIVSSASTLLAGVFYPVDILPGLLQGAAQVLPLTHALEIVRRAVFAGAGLADVWPSLVALVVLTVILVPIGISTCQVAVRLAKTDGSLSHY